MNLFNFTEGLARKSVGQSHERRPKATMNISNLVVCKCAGKHRFGIIDFLHDRVNIMTPGMPPPAATNWFSGNASGERRLKALLRLENNAMIANEIHCLARIHGLLMPPDLLAPDDLIVDRRGGIFRLQLPVYLSKPEQEIRSESDRHARDYTDHKTNPAPSN